MSIFTSYPLEDPPHAYAWGFIFFVLSSIAVDIHTFGRIFCQTVKKSAKRRVGDEDLARECYFLTVSISGLQFRFEEPEEFEIGIAFFATPAEETENSVELVIVLFRLVLEEGSEFQFPFFLFVFIGEPLPVKERLHIKYIKGGSLFRALIMRKGVKEAPVGFIFRPLTEETPEKNVEVRIFFPARVNLFSVTYRKREELEFAGSGGQTEDREKANLSLFAGELKREHCGVDGLVFEKRQSCRYIHLKKSLLLVCVDGNQRIREVVFRFISVFELQLPEERP
jgi:hypothetical protein